MNGPGAGKALVGLGRRSAHRPECLASAFRDARLASLQALVSPRRRWPCAAARPRGPGGGGGADLSACSCQFLLSWVPTRARLVISVAVLSSSSSIGSNNGSSVLVAPRSREPFAVLFGGAVRRLTGVQRSTAQRGVKGNGGPTKKKRFLPRADGLRASDSNASSSSAAAAAAWSC